MANFEISHRNTKGFEIGYSNDKDDRGGESYNGISRVYNPGWGGWEIIDGLKSIGRVDLINNNGKLDKLADKFYKQKHWDALQLDNISDQAIADELFDNAVNMGNGKSIEYLQRSLNILNRNEREDFYRDLLIDRKFGPVTFNALTVAIKKNSKMLLNIINGFQVKHYIEIMEFRPKQEKYIGWFKRVTISWGK